MWKCQPCILRAHYTTEKTLRTAAGSETKDDGTAVAVAAKAATEELTAASDCLQHMADLIAPVGQAVHTKHGVFSSRAWLQNVSMDRARMLYSNMGYCIGDEALGSGRGDGCEYNTARASDGACPQSS